MSTRRYTVISSDCHAGGHHDHYREYLDPQYRDDFDAWRGRYRNPFRDLQGDTRSRNWDDARRIADLDGDGVVAEVVFPNTIPPFFPTGQVVAPAPSPADYERRMAGLRAHNRWLADFCAAHPKRRAGLVQVMLNSVDDAVAEVRWANEHGLRGVLLPGVSPDTPWIEPLFSPVYDPLWATCEDLGMSITHHSGGSGLPAYPNHPATTVVFVLEVGFFANRALWHLTMSGVFERFPGLVFAMTEQGCGWVPGALAQMDRVHATIARHGRIGELPAHPDVQLPMKPSEYFARNCYLGASFPSPADATVIRQIGVDRVMWGSDYPHNEACFPFSREALRQAFHDWSEAELRAILAENAATVYGFDLGALAPLAAAHGPTVEELSRPLDAVPAGATSPCFIGA